MAQTRDLPKRRRPMLMALVFGVFLVLVGATASALVAIASVHLSTASLKSVVDRDRSLVELFVNDNLRPSDLDPDRLTEGRAAQLEAKLAALIAEDAILRIEIRSADGTILLASTPGLRGQRPSASEAMAATAAGDAPSPRLVAGSELLMPGGERLPVAQAVEEFLPLKAEAGNATLAVVALWRDATPLLAGLDDARRDIVIVTLVAAALLAIILYLLFRAAQARLSRQQAQLLEAERRDPLTGLLNHGAVVSLLADQVEKARSGALRVAVVLLDIDNFRLLNDTHGHEAADEVLLRVAELMETEASNGAHVARYGPDEFLLARFGAGVGELESAVDRLREGVAGLTVQFGDSERLPVTVSAGIAAAPEHADSVTGLLSAAAVALNEAKSSGGDAVRVARIGPDERVAAGSFDVLQGLVIAVDTKDRYTKRHSEDVARYALFLATRLGLDEMALQTIRVAGLLHDVGKIGIPDSLLRKPGKLTADEFEIFKQHVALGDAIVRDVPDVTQVRAGIRHHHERWDGRGYLQGLEGEDIPLLGRILAVADAFSAMTTTRPYRKGLSVEEALKRLGDAAGTQLQEELVTAFVKGIETAPDAPLPGEASPAIWRPTRQVA